MNSYIESQLNDDNEDVYNDLKIPLYDYQKTEINKMIKCDNKSLYGIRGGISSLRMGLGKSPISLCHFLIRKKKFEAPSLIVCNYSMLGGWETEINKFLYTSDNDTEKEKIKYFIFHNTYNKNIEKLKDLKNINLVITTYDVLIKYSKQFNLLEKNIIYDDDGKKIGFDNCKKPSFKGSGFKLLFSTIWNSIYLDESHKISNNKSITFNSVMCLYGLSKWCLTGTPIRNYSIDLFSQFRFLGFNKCLDVNKFDINEYNKYNLQSRMLFKNYEDDDVKKEIHIPESVDHLEFLELSTIERQLYNYYKQCSKKIYKGYINGNYNYINIFSMLTKLRQISVCPYILSESSNNDTTELSISQKIYEDMPEHLKENINNVNSSFGIFSTKIVRILEILNSKKGEKFLIFGNFKKVFDVLKLAIETHSDNKCLILTGDVKGLSRNKVIQSFKHDNKFNVFLINHKVGSEGLTLVEANNVILIDHWWNESVELQSIARAKRIGQTKKVETYKLYIKDSIEEDILNICKKKRELSNEFLFNKENVKNKNIIEQLIR